MATAAQFASTPVIGSGLLTTADTSLTSPSTVQTIIPAGANGTRIDNIEIIGVANTVAGIVNLFLYNGTTYSLWTQIPVVANTVSTTALSWRIAMSSVSEPLILPISLPNTWSLRATTTVSQSGIRVIAYGGNY